MARSDILNGLQLSVSLDRYQELMRFPEAAFNGLYRNSDQSSYDCAARWKQIDLDAMAMSLMEAEEMRERELGYYLAPKYMYEEVAYNQPMILNHKHLIDFGTETTDLISSGESTDLPSVILDPVVLTVATTVINASEILVTYHDEMVAIHPSKVVISGGNAIITIPLSRLINPTVCTNCDNPIPQYTDADNYLTEVDIYRRWYDPSTAITLVWYGSDCAYVPFGGNPLTTTTQSAYGRVTASRIAALDIFPASYSNGVWTSVNYTQHRRPDKVRIAYRSGRQYSMYTEIETAKLANSMLPHVMPARIDMCGTCWKPDQMPDDSKIKTPYGTSSGAVKAWISDARAKVGQGGTFPRLRS